MKLMLGVVAASCVAIQIASAAWVPRSFDSPNESSQIARRLASDGVYTSEDPRSDPVAAGAVPPRAAQAYQLPGEPLYLAAGFRALPAGLWPYLHVPVTTAFVTAIALVACLAAGPAAGLATGLIASVDPFIVLHGPVWDDTFLAAAGEWWILAGLMYAQRQGGVSWRLAGALTAASAVAALSRMPAQIVLVASGALLLVVPSLRTVRRAGAALVVGVVVAVGAWGARNAATMGTFFIGSTHDGKTLFESNCAATRANLLATGHVGGWIYRCDPSVVAAAIAQPEVVENAAFALAAWTYVTSHPLDVARTSALKTLVSVTGVNPAAAPGAPRNLAAVALSLALMGFGVPGLARLLRRPLDASGQRGLLLVFGGTLAVVTLAVLAAGPTGLRYQVSASGLLLVGAGVETSRRRASAWAKRGLDVGLSGVGLIASLPVWAAVAALVKFEDGGEIFYGQDRVGEGGRIFRVLKFRSMVPDAEANVGALQASAHDPRITKVGRWLRATAADELPQLWNIFRGDMSFVGPRALRPGEIEAGGDGRLVALEDVPGFEDRCRVRPGLTGVAQIYAPRDIPRRHKFQYDRIYIRKQSFGLDLRLILLSFWITLRGTWEVRGQKF